MRDVWSAVTELDLECRNASPTCSKPVVRIPNNGDAPRVSFRHSVSHQREGARSRLRHRC